MATAVNEQSDAIKALSVEWAVIEALMGGTPAMRAGQSKYLPRWPNEGMDSYLARLQTATLFPALRRTVSVMAGKPFAKAVTLQDNVPAQIRAWAEDIDRQGVNLHAFAAEMFAEAVAFGLCGILVDYPDTTVRDAQGRPVQTQQRTVAQAERDGIRPYWVRVKHDQILGYRASLRNGAMQFDQLRLLESVEEPDGEWGTKAVAQVRVLYPGGWKLYRQMEKGWELHMEGRTSLGYVPFVPVYGKRLGFMEGAPPLIDLAYLNVKHWQSQSDQDTILHVARVPILAMIGVEDETALTVGAQSAVKLPVGASLEFVEHTGAAIEAGAKSLLALEEQMIQTGAELLVKKPGDRSATESANDAEANKSDLQRMVEDFEDALDLALQYTADFGRLGSGGNAVLFKDFGAGTLTDASAQLVLSMQMAGLLSKPKTIEEMKRRGIVDADTDPDVEIALAEAEGPAPGTMTTEEE